jgi:hypothetical protein
MRGPQRLDSPWLYKEDKSDEVYVVTKWWWL